MTAPANAAPTVARNAEHHRFEARVDGHTSVLTYREAAGRVTLTHTGSRSTGRPDFGAPKPARDPI